jgi:hypothetical protein
LTVVTSGSDVETVGTEFLAEIGDMIVKRAVGSEFVVKEGLERGLRDGIPVLEAAEQPSLRGSQVRWVDHRVGFRCEKELRWGLVEFAGGNHGLVRGFRGPEL